MSALHTTIRFILSGGTSAAAYFAVLYTLVTYGGLSPTIGAAFAFASAVVVNFVLQKVVTFDDRTTARTRTQAVRFILLSLTNLALIAGLTYVGTTYLHLHYLVAQVLVVGSVAIENFFAYKYLIFHSEQRSGVE